MYPLPLEPIKNSIDELEVRTVCFIMDGLGNEYSIYGVLNVMAVLSAS